MLSKVKLNELKEHLNKAQNPLFFYDNDADGLCSFILFRKFLNRGKGVAVRSYPELNENYAKRAEELNADYVFVLDKPVLSRDFVNAIDKMQLPLVWIDHHSVQGEDFSTFPNVHKFNSLDDGVGEPVTYIAHKVCNRKEDLWVAMMGCIADHFLPDFSKEFAKELPEFWAKNIKRPFDAYYGSEIGKIAQALNFGLKDSITNVVKMQNFLLNCKTPGDVFAESAFNVSFKDKYNEIKKKYDSLVNEAIGNLKDGLIFFSYGGTVSISSDISNKLNYLNPGSYIAVAFLNGNVANVSLRGKNVKSIFEKILPNMKNMSGGGHNDAVGARMNAGDLDKFKEFLIMEIKNEKRN